MTDAAKSRRRTLALLLPLVLACGANPPAPDAGTPDASGGPPKLSGPQPAVDYCESTADFFCDFYLRCGRIVAASVTECRATFLETCNNRYESRYVDLEDAGLLRLFGEGMEACKAHLATVACERQGSELAGPCAQMWVGTQPEGAPCGLDVESFTCAPGTACVLGLNLCGTCRHLLAVGDRCGDGGTCGSEAACVDGTCVERRQLSESCSATEPCVVGASCSAGTCTGPAIVAEGEACDAAHRCPYRSSCINGRCVRSALLGEDCAGRACASGRCANTGTSELCVPLIETGNTCSAALECRSASCVGGVCRRLPDACFP